MISVLEYLKTISPSKVFKVVIDFENDGMNVVIQQLTSRL
jgi:hypothetical protein